MKAMVLSAGLGTRLRPYTQVVPKPLFPICDVPVVGWALRSLVGAGVDRVIMNLHQLPAAIVRALGAGSAYGVEIEYSEEPVILGTGGGLSAVRAFFAGEAAWFVHNGDVFTDWDLSGAMSQHLQSGAVATLLLTDPPDMPEARLVEIDSCGHVIGIRGRPTSREGARYVFSGISILGPGIFEVLPEGTASCLIADGILPLIERGALVRGVVMPGRFCDVGTPGRFVALNAEWLPQIRTLFRARGLPCPTEPMPGIWSRDEASRLEGANLFGPMLLGRNVVVEPGARIGPNVVLCSGSHVTSGAVVQDAVVFPGERVEGTQSGIVLSLTACDAPPGQ